MRVLYVQGGAERAGAERMLAYLLKYLDKERFEPKVLFTSAGPFVDEVADLGIEVEVVPGPRLRNIASWHQAIDSIKRVAVDHGARLIHANGEKMSIFAARAASQSGIPSIAWLHDAPAAGGVGGRLAQRMLARSHPSSVVCCSGWLASDFNDKLDLGAVTIANGLDLDSLPVDAGAAKRLAAEQGWPTDALIVGHFTRLQRWKGTEFFLRAAAIVIEQHPDARFVVVGGVLYGREAGLVEELQGIRASLGLEDKVSFAGYRADALEVMAGCDIVVHCSVRPDPFPTVVLEGMALGKPVIATTTRGPEEAIEDKVTGTLVPPADPGALADAISQLADRPDIRVEIGRAAATVVKQKYNAARMAHEFQDLYLKLSSTTSSKDPEGTSAGQPAPGQKRAGRI
ncbi:MAG: glycosyltransferase family 4 protein [Actinobacteria bacterium]|nr:glycosyltransferase family 4 protein [Actinomycetota bacterium]